MKTFYTIIILLFFVIECSAILNGYTDNQSYRYTPPSQGGTKVTFYLDNGCGNTGCNITLQLEDLKGNNVYTIPFSIDIPANQGIPNTNLKPSEDGYGYSPSLTTWTIPDPTILPSGYYLINGIIPIIIKGDNATADIVIICPTNTVNAYTESDGVNNVTGSLYHTNNTIVSFRRPQSRDNYIHCDDGFLDWIRTWAPTLSLKLNFISDQDLDQESEITNAKLLIIPGHSEYWTRQARLNFDAFVDGGKNALILSGNTMWMQVRYQKDPNKHDNLQMVCYRGGNWCDNNPVPNCYIEDPGYSIDPLLATYHWSEPDLKYSIIGSIGSDSWRGGYGNGDGAFASGGHKIIIQSSPLLNNMNLSYGDPIPMNMNTTSNEEFDGSFMKSDQDGNALLNLNSHGDPELDISALGFYRAEMIGYHKTTTGGTHRYVPDDPHPGNLHHSYCPFMVFKKTSNSGIIINVNSNKWCCYDPPENSTHSDWVVTSPLRTTITVNMITRMLDYNNINLDPYYIFSTSTPEHHYISIKPSYSAVTYATCENGNIHFTDHGIYLYNAYKIDNGFVRNSSHIDQGVVQPEVINPNPNRNFAIIDNSCPQYNPLRLAQGDANKNLKDNEQIDEFSFSLFPNPATGKFILEMLSEYDSEKSIYIFNSIDKEIYHKDKTLEQNIDIDLSVLAKGIYFVKVVKGNKLSTKKIVLI